MKSLSQNKRNEKQCFLIFCFINNFVILWRIHVPLLLKRRAIHKTEKITQLNYLISMILIRKKLNNLQAHIVCYSLVKRLTTNIKTVLSLICLSKHVYLNNSYNFYIVKFCNSFLPSIKVTPVLAVTVSLKF